MSLESAIQIATLFSVIVGFVSLILSINIYRRKMNAEIVMKYAERFQQIIEFFPEDLLLEHYLHGNHSAHNKGITLSAIKYFNFCSEEFYLQKKGYMSQEVWRVWEADMKRLLKTSFLKKEWESLRSHYKSFPEFFKYVEGVYSDELITE